MSSSVLTGSITTIIGPMFSGKTTEMLRLLRLKARSGKKCIVVRYSGDTRYNLESITNHDGIVFDGYIMVKGNKVQCADVKICNNIKDVDMDLYDVLAIDELHFFTDETEYLNKLANNGKYIIVSGLHSSFEQKPIGQFLTNVLAISDDIKYMPGLCRICGGIGTFNIRTNDSKELIEVGGDDKYMTVCRNCRNTKI